MNKQCSKCKEVKPESAFSKNNKTKDGLRSECACCSNSYHKQYNKTEKRKLDRQSAAKSYRELKRGTNYFEDYTAQYRANNKEHIKELCKEWAKKNPDKRKTTAHKRRAKKKAALHPEHNFEIERLLHKLASVLSKNTGIAHSLDHIIPLEHGGLHHHDNMQVIPARINSAKQHSLRYKHPDILHWSQLPESVIQMHPKEVQEKLKAA